MGIYRLLLAIFVILNHLDITLHGFRMGSVAVVSFFLLSGYVMTALIHKYYRAPQQIFNFYLDRIMRLFPQFLFYLAMTLLLIVVAHPKSIYINDVTVPKVLLNTLMLPLGFYMYDGLFNSQIIPQAWSLGLELSFYFAIPIILVYRIRWPVFLLSAMVFVLARFEVIDAQYFSYRLLPGTLFLFLCGSFLQASHAKRDQYLLYATYLMAFVFVVLDVMKEPIAQTDYNRQVLFGLLIGLPMVWMLSNKRWGVIDNTFGNISYGVFLNHFFLIWLFQCIGVSTESFVSIVILISTAIVLAWASYYWIERPVILYRHRLRNREQSLSYPSQILPEGVS
ncbi:MAG: acyltransferase [Gammaproteobacteria bacterium]|nr:acyltransferase [Gammaproteobacteria bacterium]